MFIFKIIVPKNGLVLKNKNSPYVKVDTQFWEKKRAEF